MCVEREEVIQEPGGCARVVGGALLVVVVLAVLVGCVNHGQVELGSGSEVCNDETQ